MQMAGSLQHPRIGKPVPHALQRLAQRAQEGTDAFLRERCSVQVHQRYGDRAQIREPSVSALLSLFMTLFSFFRPAFFRYLQLPR